MSKINKVGSVNKDRIHRMYVDRKTVVSGVASIEKIDPIKPVHNEASSVNENFLLFTGSFYDKIEDLKKYYNKFYLDHQDLGNLMEKFKDQKSDDSLEEIITIINELVDKFNKAIGSLRSFEAQLPNINFSQEIYEAILSYESELSTIGITLSEEHDLTFDPDTLKNNLESQPNCLFFLFDHQKGLIRNLFTIFRNIKVSRIIEAYSYGNSSDSISGLLIDSKL
ncbi:hypothetical protein [Alkaliphilus transvaalensis]|uniref:hypothetical protein n=1 Tax=Alkaliphilus transvaalensis TaxID=114628 RepID=UPI00047B2AC7|nr:hypothetical protein [Alkaliphilus transvaalensis]